MNDHDSSSPQGLQSLLSNLTGGAGNNDNTVTEVGDPQDQKRKKGLLGDVMSG